MLSFTVCTRSRGPLLNYRLGASQGNTHVVVRVLVHVTTYLSFSSAWAITHQSSINQSINQSSNNQSSINQSINQSINHQSSIINHQSINHQCWGAPRRRNHLTCWGAPRRRNQFAGERPGVVVCTVRNLCSALQPPLSKQALRCRIKNQFFHCSF